MRNTDRLKRIYSKTDGYCHLCHKKLSFVNYNSRGAKGAWNVEHSLAVANGGTDHMNNLYAACISCNEEKGTYSTRSFRAANGHKRAPYNSNKKQKLRRQYANNGMVIGGALGAFLGPEGAIIGAIVGRIIGADSAPRR